MRAIITSIPKGTTVKTLILTVGFLFLPLSLYSQASVRTEQASNRFKFYSAATTGDTVFTAAAQATGGGVDFPETVGYIVDVFVSAPVASDSIEIKNGAGTVAYVIVPASGAVPTVYPINARADTSLIYIQKKTSKVKLGFRTGY